MRKVEVIPYSENWALMGLATERNDKREDG